MKQKLKDAAVTLALYISIAAGSILFADAAEYKVSEIARLPFADGHGTAGAFIGSIGDLIVIAGGSDFNGARPWEGGTKQASSRIFIIKCQDGKYICKECHEASLPQPLYGGAAASSGKSIWCFGGSDGNMLNTDILEITVQEGNVSIHKAGTSPESFIPAAACHLKGKIFIHGTENGANNLYRFSPANGSWKKCTPCPAPAISEGAPLVCQHNGKEDAIYLIGGRGKDGETFHLNRNVWEYSPLHDTWSKKAEITIDSQSSALMYSSASAFGSGHIIIAGGDDGEAFLRREALSAKILEAGSPEARDSLEKALVLEFTGHEGFSDKIFAYHPITDTWITVDSAGTGFPVATTAIKAGNRIIIPSGEIRPGVRKPSVIGIEITDKASFGLVNYIVILLYLTGMLGIGFYFSRKENSTEQFFRGGAKIPWWAAGISIFATALSAITFISIPAKAYGADWSMFMFNMTILMVVPIVIHFYLPFFRKLNVASAYQYLEERFSLPVRYLASLFFCLFMFARIAIVLFLPSLALNAVTGMNVYVCILLMGAVTVIYCTLGGIEAVVWGDVVQGFILVAGAILSLVWIISGVEGGASEVLSTAIDNDKFNILDFSLDWTRPVFWVTLAGGISNQLLTYTSDQSVIQRYMTVRDTSGTKKGLWLNGLLSIPIALLFFSIGTGLFVFFKTHPQMLNVSMNNTDSIFPHYIMCELPVGIAGLLIAAIFAAAMSTLSSNINSASTIMTEDFYSKMRKGLTDSQKMRFAKSSGMIVGTLGIGMAVILATFDIASLWDQFNFFLGLLTSGVGGLFMMGIFTRRIGTRSAFTGFAGSIAVLLICNRWSHVSMILYGFIGLVSCFAIGYISSFIYGYRK